MAGPLADDDAELAKAVPAFDWSATMVLDLAVLVLVAVVIGWLIH